MTPDSRWLLASAFALATLVWITLSHEHTPLHSGRRWPRAGEVSEASPAGANVDADAAAAESRWLGQGVVVRHLPPQRRTRFTAHPDGEGRWTSTTPEQNAGALDRSDEPVDRAEPATSSP